MGTNLPIVNSFLGLFVSIGLRLKEERERLDLNQTDFAKIGGVGRKSQFNYEENERSPDAAYLAAIAEAGADIQYIVTGQRSDMALTPDERELLALYRASSLTGKMAAVGALQGGMGATSAPKVKKQVFNKEVSGQVALGNIVNKGDIAK